MVLETPLFSEEEIKPLYKEIHADFVLNLFKAEGYEIIRNDELHCFPLAFECRWNNKLIGFDFADSKELQLDPNKYHSIVKFHSTKDVCGTINFVYAVSPASFYAW